MLTQLKRQASAHSEHLAEELATQAKTLDQQHRTELETKLDEQHRVYYRELEKKVKSISAIQAKVCLYRCFLYYHVSFARVLQPYYCVMSLKLIKDRREIIWESGNFHWRILSYMVHIDC